jgi:hypothetical protein
MVRLEKVGLQSLLIYLNQLHNHDLLQMRARHQ